MVVTALVVVEVENEEDCWNEDCCIMLFIPIIPIPPII